MACCAACARKKTKKPCGCKLRSRRKGAGKKVVQRAAVTNGRKVVVLIEKPGHGFRLIVMTPCGGVVRDYHAGKTLCEAKKKLAAEMRKAS